MDLELQFGPHAVGIAVGAVWSDHTWHAVFRASPDMPSRVRDYVAFCEEWHDRLQGDRPCSAAEFEAWADVYASPAWQACGPGEQVRPVDGPVFTQGEVTWRGLPDAEQDGCT